jgi:hypothetical protein
VEIVAIAVDIEDSTIRAAIDYRLRPSEDVRRLVVSP